MEQSDRDRSSVPPHLDEGTAHAWLDDALSPEEAEGVAEHVAACSACAALVAEARGLIAASSRIVTALDDVPGGVLPSTTRSAPPMTASESDVAPRVAARRQHDDVRLVPPPRPARRMPTWVRGLAAAASLVVVTGTVLRLSGGGDGVASLATTYEQAVSDSVASGPSVAGAASAAGAPSMAPAAEGAAAAPLPVRAPPPPSPVADAADRAASIGAAARMERSRVAGVAGVAEPKAIEQREVLALQGRAADADVSAKAVAAAPPAAPVVPVAPQAAPPVVTAQRAAGSGGGAAAANAARSPAQGAVASATAESRFLAEQSTRQVTSFPFAPGTIARRAGCYAITRGGQAGASAPPPSTVRLTDSAVTASPTTWLRARLAGDASGGSLSWSPIDSARAMLRVAAATDTSTFIITFAGEGREERAGRAAAAGWVATRVDCR